MHAGSVNIERRGVKNARLRVSETGSVGLIVPVHYTDEQVDGLLARKAKWIDDKRRFFARRAPVKRRLNPNELRLFGETFLYVHTPALRHRTELDYRGRLIRTGIDLADGESRQRWYRRFAKQHLNACANEMARIHGFSFHRLYVRAPWKRWGSCSAMRNISLNWRLIEAPKDVIDYVILHELLHTRLLTHDHRFWAHLRAICPHALQAREWLEKNAPQIEPRAA
jgi:predicted metal-dependent hydrolase